MKVNWYGTIPTMLPIKTNINNEKTNGKYFFPLSPTVSLRSCAIKLYISSDTNCILEGINDQETIDFKTGARKVGQMKNGLMHGKGIITYVSGTKHKGEFSEGKKNGLGRVFYIGGMTFEGNFKNDQRHGEALIKYVNGAEIKSYWNNGSREILPEGEYFDGQVDRWNYAQGYGTYYYPDGSSIKAEYQEELIVSDYQKTT